MPLEATDLELDYRVKNFQDFTAVEQKQIACATCGRDVSIKLNKPGGLRVHPLLTTLQCKKCSNFYGDGNFSMDEEDGEDKYCRMCGNGGELFICGNESCPYGFCHNCIMRYVGENFSEVQADDWKCFHCNCKPLWEARAICALILAEYPRNRRKHNKKPTGTEVYKSNDNCISPENVDRNFQNSKPSNNYTLRTRRSNTLKENAISKKFDQTYDSSHDSIDDFNPSYKHVGHKQDSNAQSKYSKSSTAQTSVSKKKSFVKVKKKNRRYNIRISSDEESTDLEGNPTTSMPGTSCKFDNISTEVVFKNGKRSYEKLSVDCVATDKQSKQVAEQHIDFKTKNSENNVKFETSDLQSSSDDESSQSKQVKHLSQKMRDQTLSKLSSYRADGILDERISPIKLSYAKFNSVEGHVNKDQGEIIQAHTKNLLCEMDKLGRALCIGTDRIAKKHLMHDFTSVTNISKTILKCLLLTKRCNRDLSHMYREFTGFYQDWSHGCGVSSILSNLGNAEISTSSKAETLTIKKSSINAGMNDIDKQSSKIKDDKNLTKSDDHTRNVSNTASQIDNNYLNIQCNVDASDSSAIKEKFTIFTKNSDYHESSQNRDENLNSFVNDEVNSDEDLKNSTHFNISDCDSNEIFSENESRKRVDRTNAISLKASRELLIESVEKDSDEFEQYNSETRTVADKCLQVTDTNKNQDRKDCSKKQLIGCEKLELAKESNANRLQADQCIKNLEYSNSLPQVTFDETTLYSCEEDSDSTFHKLILSDSEKSNQQEISSTNDNFTVISRERTLINESKSISTEETRCEENTLIHNSLTDTSKVTADLSDCENEFIFTQSTSNDSNADSRTINVPVSTNLVANEEDRHIISPCVSTIKVSIDTEMPKIDKLQNGTKSDDNIVIPAETVLDSPKTLLSSNSITKRNDDAINSSENKNVEESNGIEFREQRKTVVRSIDDRSDVLEKVPNETKSKEVTTTYSSSEDDNLELKNSIVKVEEDKTDESRKKLRVTPESDITDSEETFKKMMLESDSELSDVSTVVCSRSDGSEPQKTKSLETIKLDSTDVSAAIIGRTPELTNKKSSKPRSMDKKNADLNELAKNRLLLSPNSSSSENCASTGISFSDPDTFDSCSMSSQEENEIHSNSITDQGSKFSTSSKVKIKKINLESNYYYQTDQKLQRTCRVVVRRLNEKSLGLYKHMLGKSAESDEYRRFKSLIDLSNVEKRKRGTCNQDASSSDSSSSKSSSKKPAKRAKSKQPQEKEETLMDHLERIENGGNICDFSVEDIEESFEVSRRIPTDETTETDSLANVNNIAKNLLMQSSDSENELNDLIGNEETYEAEEKSEVGINKNKKNEQNNENSTHGETGSESHQENGSDAEKDDEDIKNTNENGDSKESENSDSEGTRAKKRMKKKLASSNWRLTDSDSSTELQKWEKSLLKEEDEISNAQKEDKSKRKKKTKRMILGSDSDSVKLTDLSDDSIQELERKEISASNSEDSSDLFDKLEVKRRKKRNTGRKSNSDLESEQDDKPMKQKRKRIKTMESESDSDSDTLANSQDTSGKLHRKNIRKVLKDKHVADVTKIAGKEEEERLKRIAERQKLYNEMYEMKLASEAKVDKLVLDFDEETKKELISVHEGLVKQLKPHQAQGIKFMWDACFESLERIKSTKGSGCIVAHCMGLGKTFQVVTLAHTLLTHSETGVKTIMIICPLSTVLNWVNEFKKWLGDINNDEDVEVYEMTKMKKNFERKYQLERWYRSGGVMVLGYEMFRLLSNPKVKKMRKSLHEAILKCLVDPGPDLIVCDEGHLLKNEDTALSKAMKKVKTLRRIVLTGTPLQNNLVEYHCMVQFVKPNLLGTKKEFLNRFVNPITNGQFDDSTEYDVKLMKKRAHVLHKMLEGSVQRFDYSVLTPFLPPKQEYVITVRLADIQIKLYQHYLDHQSRKKVGQGTTLFADFQALQRIWTHPIVLRMNAEKMERINEKKRLDASDSEGSLRDFLDDGSDDKTTTSSDSDIQSSNGSSDDRSNKPGRRGTRNNPIDLEEEKPDEEDAPQSGEWWSQFVEPEHFEDMRVSSKLVLLFAILEECERIGDKVLVFSQSLYALSLIEEFLNKIDEETQKGTCSELIDGHSGSWSLGLDYFRLDGQTTPENRSQYCKIFNNPKNSRARLFLISTRAGGLGINLTAANRVVIFDASWNPSHDVQSIFRIYRFGQKKPCYVYRFLAQGTMEEKIYNRQVTKLSLSCRVVDEQQIERHYSNHDLAELYQFEPKTNKDKPTLNLPKDRLLAEIFRKYEDRIETFHEHDSLLENKAEEELDEEERKQAWREYEDERTGRKMYMNNFQNQNVMQQYNGMLHMNQAEIANLALLAGINVDRLQAMICNDHPNATPEQQTAITTRVIMDMYNYMESETIRQQQMAAAASSFTYPTVSNLGSTNFVNKPVMTPAQQQYTLQQQQQQQQFQQLLIQREQQANYAKRYGNVRVPATSTIATRTPQVVDLQNIENDVVEIPTALPTIAGPVTSVQAPSVSAPVENSKRQEE